MGRNIYSYIFSIHKSTLLVFIAIPLGVEIILMPENTNLEITERALFAYELVVDAVFSITFKLLVYHLSV